VHRFAGFRFLLHRICSKPSPKVCGLLPPHPFSPTPVYLKQQCFFTCLLLRRIFLQLFPLIDIVLPYCFLCTLLFPRPSFLHPKRHLGRRPSASGPTVSRHGFLTSSGAYRLSFSPRESLPMGPRPYRHRFLPLFYYYAVPASHSTAKSLVRLFDRQFFSFHPLPR